MIAFAASRSLSVGIHNATCMQQIAMTATGTSKAPVE